MVLNNDTQQTEQESRLMEITSGLRSFKMQVENHLIDFFIYMHILKMLWMKPRETKF